MTTLPRKLLEAGYRTHHIGKWDVGYSSPGRIPVGRGFESSFGYLKAFNGYLGQWAGDQPTHCPQFPGYVEYGDGSGYKGWCTAPSVQARHLSYTTDLWDTNGPAYGQNGTGYEEALFTSRAVGIIEGHDQNGPPLFLYYAMHLLHSPNCAPPEYVSRFAYIDNEDRRYVAAMIAVMDDAVGAVVRALKRTGLWKDTLFIWSSDNGAAIEMVTGAKSAYPLRGGYYTNWEGGIRAPALVNGGFLPTTAQGRKVEGYVHIADWYATLCGLAGAKSDDQLAAMSGLPPPDSLDVWPLITGLNATSPRQEWLQTPLKGDHQAGGPGDPCYFHGPYKLLVNSVYQASWCGPKYPNNSVQWHTYQTVEHCTTRNKKACLFNVMEDPTEHHDLALKMPELVDTMLARMQELQKTVYDPMRGQAEVRDACAAVVRNGGFWGPWRDDHGPMEAIPGGVPQISRDDPLESQSAAWPGITV
jgi:arylsulfatase I/J